MPTPKPNSSIRKAISIMALVIALSGTQHHALAARYVDTSQYWGERYINKLSDEGILKASEDGLFKPDAPVTRAELAQWLVDTLKLGNQPVSNTPSFKDVPVDDPYFKAIEIIRQNNYISGYSDGFRPKQFIQRGEMITIIARALNLAEPDENKIESTLDKFDDKEKIPQWARAGIAKADQAGILVTREANRLDATGIASRGDTAVLLCSLADYLNRREIAHASNKSERYPQQMPAPEQGYRNEMGYQQEFQQVSPQNFDPRYHGEVRREGLYGNEQAGGQMPFGRYPGQGSYPGAGMPSNYAAMPPPGYYQSATAQHSAPLSGRITTISAGTLLGGTLRNSINSETSQPGEPVEVSLSQPVYSGGAEALPAGSTLVGQITNVVSARRFRFGANGQINIKFTQVVTPDGRRFPLSASVDTSQVNLSGGSTAGRVGKGALTTAVGAGSGAALGTALGAIVGGTSDGRVGKATGMGAVFGTAIGGGVGLAGAGVRKGSEVMLKAGMNIPVQIDQTFQVSSGSIRHPSAQPPPIGYPAPDSPMGY